MRFIIYGIIITIASTLILHHVFGVGKPKDDHDDDKNI